MTPGKTAPCTGAKSRTVLSSTSGALERAVLRRARPKPGSGTARERDRRSVLTPYGGGGTRVDTEVGYGLPVSRRFVGTPRVGLRTSEYGRDYRVGYGVQVLEEGQLRLQLGVEAERPVSPVVGLGQGLAGGAADQRVLGQASVEC